MYCKIKVVKQYRLFCRCTQASLCVVCKFYWMESKYTMRGPVMHGPILRGAVMRGPVLKIHALLAREERPTWRRQGSSAIFTSPVNRSGSTSTWWRTAGTASSEHPLIICEWNWIGIYIYRLYVCINNAGDPWVSWVLLI